jgi:hypothetical protein
MKFSPGRLSCSGKRCRRRRRTNLPGARGRIHRAQNNDEGRAWRMADERSLLCIAPAWVTDVRSEGNSEATVSTAACSQAVTFVGFVLTLCLSSAYSPLFAQGTSQSTPSTVATPAALQQKTIVVRCSAGIVCRKVSNVLSFHRVLQIQHAARVYVVCR